MRLPGLDLVARLAAARVADAMRARTAARMRSERRQVTRISRLARGRLFLLGFAQNLEHPVDPVGRKSNQARIGMAELEDEKDRDSDGDCAGEMRQHAHRVRR